MNRCRFASFTTALLLTLICCLAGRTRVSAQDAATQPPETTTKAADQRETLKQLATMLQRDWKDQPEWAQMATAVLAGDSMGVGKGWFKPSQTRYDWPWLAARFDQDKSDSVERSEIECDDESFRRLDRDGNGTLTAADLDWQAAGNRNDSAARMASMLYYRLDADSNGKITAEEWSAFFQMLDAEQAGFFTAEELQAVLAGPRSAANAATQERREFRPGTDPLEDLQMLLSGQFGSLTSGPALKEAAPDFTLPRNDGSATVSLSQLRGKPVVLIFGSFT